MSNLTNQEVIKILNVWGPEAIEEGLITEQEVYRALGSSSDKGAYKYNKAGGGMMNMDEMTRPLGYKFGTKDGELVGDREQDLKEWEEDTIDRLRKVMEREKFKKNILKNLPEIFDDPKKLEEFFKKIPGEEKKEKFKEKGPYKFKNIDPEKFIEKGPYIIPRDEEGNRIPFEQPAPKPFIITPEMREKFKEMNPIQLLGSGIFSKAAEASTRIDFLKSRRAQLMSDIQGEMLGNIFGTGVDEGKIKILQIEIEILYNDTFGKVS